jgi:hypothetical protein
VGATAIVLLTAPAPGRVTLPIVRGDVDDPRFRRLALHAGLPVVVHAKTIPGDLSAAARDTGSTLVELVAPSCEATPDSVAVLLGALRRIAQLVGVMSSPALALARGHAPNGPEHLAHDGTTEHGAGEAGVIAPGRRPATFSRLVTITASAGGLVDILGWPGQAVKRDAVLGRIGGAWGGTPSLIVSPRDAVVVEAPDGRAGRLGARRGATLFRLAVGPRPARARLSRLVPAMGLGPGAEQLVGLHGLEPMGVLARTPAPAPAAAAAALAASAVALAASAARPLAEHAMRVGWVERVSLPLLGIDRLKAKIDTGARTSALHVSRMRPVGTAAGPHRRPILEITIPRGGGRGHRTLVVRAPVREHVQVKDTSGRTERRPVIETTIRLGTLERRIRVTLTDRGDMLFPMLIGRTALGAGIVVDPARRYLVPPPPPTTSAAARPTGDARIRKVAKRPRPAAAGAPLGGSPAGAAEGASGGGDEPRRSPARRPEGNRDARPPGGGGAAQGREGGRQDREGPRES